VSGVVLDSFAVLAYLYREGGHEKVIEALEAAARTGTVVSIIAPNWAEVRYIVERKSGSSRWSEVREKLLSLPIEVIDADQELAESAGELMATRKMSLSECFAAALAIRKDARLFTDDPAFKEVEDLVRIVWLTRR